MRYLNRALMLLFPVAWSLGAGAADVTVQIDEWEVPYHMGQDGTLQDSPPTAQQQETRPRDPWIDSLGRAWFCGQMGNYIAVFDPESEEFQRYALSEGAHPHSLILDGQDNVWYTGNLDSHIGKLDPYTGKIRRYPTGDLGVTDPHTMVWDENGDMWFTAQHSAFIGKLTVSTGEVQVIKIEDGSRVYGIKMDSSYAPWVSLF